MAKHWKYALVVVLALLVGNAAVAAGAEVKKLVAAAIPGSDGTIHACYTTPIERGDDDNNSRQGQLRAVSDPIECTKNETALSWNQKGDKGDTGPQGEQGPPGPPSTSGGGLVVSECSPGSGAIIHWVLSQHSPDLKPALPIPRTGKLLSLAINPSVNHLTGGDTQVTVLVNGADTALQINIPAGSTAVQTVLAEVPVAAGDLVKLEVDARATGLRTGEINRLVCFATYEYRPD